MRIDGHIQTRMADIMSEPDTVVRWTRDYARAQVDFLGLSSAGG